MAAGRQPCRLSVTAAAPGSTTGPALGAQRLTMLLEKVVKAVLVVKDEAADSPR